MKVRPLTVLGRLGLFTVLWFLLAGARWETPAIAVLAVVASTVTSLLLWPSFSFNIRWTRVPALTAYFLNHSVLGGIDVARRAFLRRLPLNPEFIQYQTTLHSEAGRVLFVWMIGMMPGSASVDLEGADHITVHVIDAETYDHRALASLETKLAAIFDASSQRPPTRKQGRDQREQET